MATKLSEIRTVRDVVEHFRTLPAVRDQEAKAAAELEAQRADWSAQLERVRRRRAGLTAKGEPDAKSELARLAKASEAADAAVIAAERALQEARTHQWQARSAITSHTVACDQETSRLEGALLESADPRIGDFIEWCYNAIDAARKGFQPPIPVVTKDEITDKRTEDYQPGNQARVEEIIAALRGAIAAAEQLRLTSGVDVGAELERLAASIPALAPNSRAIDQESLRKLLAGDEYADERRGWMSRVGVGR